VKALNESISARLLLSHFLGFLGGFYVANFFHLWRLTWIVEPDWNEQLTKYFLIPDLKGIKAGRLRQTDLCLASVIVRLSNPSRRSGFPINQTVRKGLKLPLGGFVQG
jgi:hypothetical protein